jgi:hypothetical protein
MPPVIKFIAKAVAVVIILLAALLVGGTRALMTYETHAVDSFFKGIGELDTAHAIARGGEFFCVLYHGWDRHGFGARGAERRVIDVNVYDELRIGIHSWSSSVRSPLT